MMFNVADDLFDLPDTLYLTDNSIASVAHATNIVTDGLATVADRQVVLTANATSGWNYFRVFDPGSGQFRLARVVRSDGVELPVDNFWQTDRTFIGQGKRPIRENILHFADKDSTGSYTLYYEPKDTTPPVLLGVTGPIDAIVATPVDSIEVVFSRAIDLSTFAAADLEITRDGVVIALPPTISVTELGNATYRISGLTTVTSVDGSYRLSVRGTGIADNFGVVGFGTQSTDWDMAGSIVSPSRTDLPPLRNTPLGTVRVTFTRPVNTSSFTAEDLSLTRNGSQISITGTLTFVAESPNVVRIDGLATTTVNDGDYTLTIDGSGVTSPDGTPGKGRLVATWKTDTIAPAIERVTPDQTGSTCTPVTSTIVVFSRPISQQSFTSSNFSLTRNGVAVALSGLSLTTIDRKTFRVTGLAAFNDIDGDYVLNVSTASVIDEAGNRGTGVKSTRWSLDRISPNAASGLSFARNLSPSAVNGPPTTGSVSGTTAVGMKVTISDLTSGRQLSEFTSTASDFAIPVDLGTMGNHLIQVRVFDAAGNYADWSLQVFLDPTPLLIERIDGLPSLRSNTVVDTIDISFSKAITASSFTLADLKLTRNGGSDILNSAVALSRESDRKFRVTGLSGLTAIVGLYEFTIRVDGVTDLDGVAGTGSSISNWVYSATAAPDITPPQSRVESLPPLSDDESFIVRWSGTDDASGVASFDVFVSVDGGQFSKWLSGTSLTASVFIGEFGRKYHFYSIATDTVGNVETAPSVPDAFTTVVALSNIRGVKFEDMNGNARKDANEPGLDGWTIFIDANNNGALDLGERSGVTANGGFYEFSGLRLGTYTIAELVQSGWIQTYPGTLANALGASRLQNPFALSVEDSATGHRDVNDDGFIDPLDVLTIINLINENTGSMVVNDMLNGSMYYNVNGDEYVNALDVLSVINHLNGSIPDTMSTSSGNSPSKQTSPTVAYRGVQRIDLAAGTTAADVDFAFGNYSVRAVVPNGFVQISPPIGRVAAINKSGASATNLDFDFRLQNRNPSSVELNGSAVPENSASLDIA